MTRKEELKQKPRSRTLPKPEEPKAEKFSSATLKSVKEDNLKKSTSIKDKIEEQKRKEEERLKKFKEEKDKLLSYKHYARMRETSEKKGQMTAAITAQYRRDQMAGHFVDRKEISHIGLESMNREQLEKRLEELESKIGEAKNIIDVTPIEVSKD